jgi:hypothetical protein
LLIQLYGTFLSFIHLTQRFKKCTTIAYNKITSNS